MPTRQAENACTSVRFADPLDFYVDRIWYAGCSKYGMDDNEKGPVDNIDARFAEMQQLILSEGERIRKHMDAIKLVLTEVRGLATKVDRLTRPRGRDRPDP
jgi:hypothetical protein